MEKVILKGVFKDEEEMLYFLEEDISGIINTIHKDGFQIIQTDNRIFATKIGPDIEPVIYELHFSNNIVPDLPVKDYEDINTIVRLISKTYNTDYKDWEYISTTYNINDLLIHTVISYSTWDLEDLINPAMFDMFKSFSFYKPEAE